MTNRPFSYSENESGSNDVSLNFVEFSNEYNRPFSHSEKESQSNDTSLHFAEFSNVHNSDRSSYATRSNLVYKNV